MDYGTDVLGKKGRDI